MIRLMVAAPSSGSGKTAVTCALLAALARRSLSPCAFKCGPDCLDPLYHRAVPGVESRNLDLFLMGPDRVRSWYAHSVRDRGAAVCEAAMGFYDGLGGSTDQGSAWRIARTLNLPVLLTVRPQGAGLSLAAVIRGLREFRRKSGIAAVLLNNCSSSLYRTLKPALEAETGLPVVGFLPHLPEAVVESRHLGLYAPWEIEDLRNRFQTMADALEANTDMDRLLSLFRWDGPEPWETAAPEPWEMTAYRDGSGNRSPVPIAVARDEAFCFLDGASMETLEACGGELVYFSPLRDTALPEGVRALYLPGGYPERYAETLSQNDTLRGEIARAVRDGLPTVAEGGGFLYLGKSLRDERGKTFPMAGALPGESFPAGHLVRFGYGTLTADRDSLLFRAGEPVPVHEFHYWDSTECGTDLTMTKPVTGRVWRCGHVSGTLYAAFPQLSFAGQPELARRLVDAARRYGT